MALLWKLKPPDRTSGFAWCDLGCGQGVTASLLAATHPDGRFFGIDAMPEHVEHARQLAVEAGAGNVQFHAATFATASELGLPPLDYVVAHGVYSWVDARSQRVLLRFVDRHLKPGGLLMVSYNAMPGWAEDVPFQRLVRAIGQGYSGSSVARFSAAFAVVRKMVDAGVPTIVRSPVLKAILDNPEQTPPAYLAHEYMVSAWKPLWATDVRAAMARIGLTPVGSATLVENYDAFVLGQEARDLLATLPEAVRETVRDFYMSQRFRRDVYVRGGQVIDEDEQRRRLVDSTFALTCPPGEVEYSMKTPPGRVGYDNPIAHGIVEALSNGPARPADMGLDATDPQDLVANLLTLCAAGSVRPVEPRGVPVSAVNSSILQRVGGPDEVLYLALPRGTAIQVERDLLLALRRRAGFDEPKLTAWARFLAAHGAVDG